MSATDSATGVGSYALTSRPMRGPVSMSAESLPRPAPSLLVCLCQTPLTLWPPTATPIPTPIPTRMNTGIHRPLTRAQTHKHTPHCSDPAPKTMPAREASREASRAHELFKHVAEKGQNDQGKSPEGTHSQKLPFVVTLYSEYTCSV